MNIVRFVLTKARPWAVSLPVILGGLLAIGAAVGWSGLVPIAASSGHWPITRWVLQRAKKRSVDTHSLGIQPPSLTGKSLIRKGAAHYETACRPCHGAPGSERPRIALSMMPPPPDLSFKTSLWEPQHLFYIVKHGIKFTGMPSWPSPGRDDEIWAMVAFLQQLPELESSAYEKLANGSDAAAATDLRQSSSPASALGLDSGLLASCNRCHDRDGLSRHDEAFPRIAGQQPGYLREALRGYATGQRHSGIMGPIASALDSQQLALLAIHFSELAETTDPAQQESSLAIERGRNIAMFGIASQRLPACMECHGLSEGPRNQNYPRLAGQHEDYLLLQLELFRNGRRGGSKYAHLMQFVVGRLTREQAEEVASYFASLPWQGSNEELP
jgi:cytochrome c553